MTLNACTAINRVNPVWDKVILSITSRLAGSLENRMPGILGPRLKHRLTMLQSEVLAHCVSLVAVDPALALLQIHRIPWKIPVDDGMTIPMEVEPFLTN